MAAERRALIVAIDGPAASGKGTIARELAARFHFAHLDTGLTYRAVARALVERGLSLDDEGAAVEAARALDLSRLDRETLSSHAVGEAASRVAVLPALRAVLVDRQRAFAGNAAAAGYRGAVLDGRDIGTVVCPGADVKLFVTATPEARAARRAGEVRARGGGEVYETVLADLKRRDARDSGRTVAPLGAAPDAVVIDTTDLSIADAVDTAVDIVKRAESD